MARGDRHGSKTKPDRVARGERSGAHTHPERVPRGDQHWCRAKPELITRGERIGTSKLIAEQVRAIRAERDASGATLKTLAKKYGVSISMISQIIQRKWWAHVD